MSDVGVFIHFIFMCFILFQVKHFLADYPFQTPYMLGKFKKTGWMLPLAAQCMVHALMTSVILLSFTDSIVALKLAALDFVIHFIMDRVKASPKMLGRFTALSKSEMRHILSYKDTLSEKEFNEKFGDRLRSNVKFWYALGFDQLIHHLTHYLIIYLLIFGGI